jgi:hypothetical protein
VKMLNKEHFTTLVIKNMTNISIYQAINVGN